MTKYNFVLLAEGEGRLLENLQELGILDVTRSSKPVDDSSSEMLARSEALRKKIADIESDNFSRDERWNALCEQIAAESKVLSAAQPWGEFDPSSIQTLADKGMEIKFHCTAAKKFQPQWNDEYALETIFEDGKNVWFVSVGAQGELPFATLPAPERSASQISASINALFEAKNALEDELRAEKDNLPSLKKEYAEQLTSLEMYLAKASTEYAVEGKISIIQGFAPSKDDATVNAALSKMDDIYYTATPATKEDNPPIKLRNNWFASQFESLTGMYGMPVYDEWDPTPILAPFFLLFFSICMGDAGYGLLLIAIAYALKGIKGAGPMGLAPYWKLIRSLGVGTFVIGIVLGTFFGISLADQTWVPDALKSVMLVGNIGQFPAQVVMALAIGVLHISLAMVVKSILYTQRFGFKETISSWGWTLLIVGGIIAFAVCSLASIPAEVSKWIVIAIAVVSALGIFVFNKIGRNPLLNIGAGLWDTYQMATGILGDVLSYIRLYALGLAGGMLGSAFNTLGGMVLGDNPTFHWIFFALIVVAGHALNLAMSCLGAFVHPLRLTFVEYFKNAGYEGTGTEFKAFRKTE